MGKYKFFSIFFTLFVYSLLVEASGITEAKAYHQNSQIQQAWATESIKSFPWKGNERVLDVGCGDGKLTSFLTEFVREGAVTGVDISPSMIEFASQTFSTTQHQNLSFLVSDVVSLPFQREFDVVVSFFCLNWVKEQETALKRIYDSLASNGKFLLVIPEKDPNGVLAQYMKQAQSEKWASHFPNLEDPHHYYSQEDYFTMLKGTGFNEIKCKATKVSAAIPNKQALLNLLKPLLPFISHLPEDLQKEYIQDMANAIMEISPSDSAGNIHIVSNRLEFTATK